MKKLFTLAIMVLCTLASNAQLRVRNDGHVEAGSVRGNCFLVNAWDSVNWVNRYGVYSDLYYSYNESTVPMAVAVYGRSAVGNYSPYEYTEVAIGVKGEAIAGYTANYGVYGYAPSGYVYGAGVYGTIYSTPKLFDNNYAGFFDGPVAITSGLYVKGGTYTSFWSQPMRSSQPKTMEDENETTSMTEQLSTLQHSLKQKKKKRI